MTSSNPIVYAAIELVEDDVETMMATHSSFENNAVELYAPLRDVEQGNMLLNVPSSSSDVADMFGALYAYGLDFDLNLSYIEEEEEEKDANTNVTELSDPDRDEEVDLPPHEPSSHMHLIDEDAIVTPHCTPTFHSFLVDIVALSTDDALLAVSIADTIHFFHLSSFLAKICYKKECLATSNTGNNSQPQATQVGVEKNRTSYRNMLMQENGFSTYENKAFEDDDIELHEGDTIRVVNVMPSIHFLDWVRNLLDESMLKTVILKLFGRQIGFHALTNKDDYANVVDEGLSVQSWTPSFSTSEMFPSTLVVWVRFSGCMYKKSVLKAIGESIGWIVKIDDNTENRTIGQFARLAVCFNLTKPLVLKISVENHTQRVEYESLPYNCYNCGHYGHTRERCMATTTDKTTANGQEVPNEPEPTI
ncbi:hypothetical protein GOBAR_DD15919 [Gossypium barbadense]|nr:hypothetical protein GOBAR_DD15919 [Gossypium barbadense]